MTIPRRGATYTSAARNSGPAHLELRFMSNVHFPQFTSALDRHSVKVVELRTEVARIEDDETAEDFEAAFSVTHHAQETPDAVLLLEAGIGMRVPVPLKLFYESLGGFEILSDNRMGHVNLLGIERLLSWTGRPGIDSAWPSLMGALCTFGSRQEFGGLKASSQEVLTKDYAVFGWAHHRYEDRTLFVFDRDGAFHNVVYEHDAGEEDWVARYRPICQKSLTGIDLDGMLAAHVAAATRRMQKQFDEGEFLG